MAVTQVPIGLNKQDFQDQDWHTSLNGGFDAANSRLTLSGTGSPNSVQIGRWVGMKYWETDKFAWWVFTGTVGSMTGWIREIPVGTIRMHHGILPAGAGAIPGWLLCDGTNGTPDLRGRFIASSSMDQGGGNNDSDYNTLTTIGAPRTGGEKRHKLTEAELPAHSHGVMDPMHFHGDGQPTYDGSGTPNGNGGIAIGKLGNTAPASTGISINNTGSDQEHENRPPYFVLFFIMKT